LYWCHLINFFQPEFKSDDIIRKAASVCYLPLLEIFEANPQARITVNFDGRLAERLDVVGHSEVMARLGALVKRGQAELTASAFGGKPLNTLPVSEAEALIEQNTKVCRRYFGEVYKPAGFFPPEMSYAPALAPIIKSHGYRWVVMDEMGHSGKPGTARADRTYKMNSTLGLQVIFRDRSISTGFLYGNFTDVASINQAIQARGAQNAYLFTGIEADIYGMRRTQPRDLLAQMIAQTQMRMVTVSELLGLVTTVEEVTPVPASWSTWDTLAF
jgi:predicted glycosyl hydrolase (DUF1957 family)